METTRDATTGPATGSTAGSPAVDWHALALDQLEWHWRGQLRPRLEGLTDAEYLWEPVPGWNVRPRGTSTASMPVGSGAATIDFADPEPVPAPVTTIAWRLAHIQVGILGARLASHFGGPAVSYGSYAYPLTADAALAALDTAAEAWLTAVRGLDAAALARPVGAAEEGWEEHPMAELVLHIHREVIHHGAEICLLRDLYAHRPDGVLVAP